MSTDIQITTKVILLLAGVVCVTVLMAIHVVHTDAGLPIIASVVAYGLGNGVAAAQGKPVRSVIESRVIANAVADTAPSGEAK